MIPVHLKFSGLYSYQRVQSINFDRLTASQLFGIFGPVGSGKSTILEAIMFVLFDRSDRLNKSGDNRYYNMLNLQSSKMEIDFVFRANAQSTSKYRAFFSAQRKKKDFEKVEVKERAQYEWKDGEWVPMPDTDASSVLGMTYENFMQTVIIPQGKFREFIDQRPHARTQMLKELFQLHRFDLGAKTTSLLRKTELAIADLEARLLEIGQVTDEDMVTLATERGDIEAKLLEYQQHATTLDQQCQGLNALRKLLDKIHDTGQELKQLQERADFYRDKEKQLRAYMKAETFFNEKFRLLEETTVEYQYSLEELKRLETRLEVGDQKVKEAKESVGRYQSEYDQRELIRQRIQDLQYLHQISAILPKHQQTQQAIRVIQRQKEEFRRQQEDQQKAFSLEEDQLKSNEKQRKRWQELHEMGLWVQRYQELLQEYHQTEELLSEYEEQSTKLQERKEGILASYGWPGSSATSTLTKELAEFQSRLHDQQDALLKEISELRVQEKLAQVASQLQDGQPCMLCGSIEHPNVAHSPSVKKDLEKKQRSLAELREEEKSFRALYQAIQKIISQSETLNTSGQQVRQRCKDLKTKLSQHQQLHTWSDIDKTSLEAIQDRIKNLQEEYQEAEKLEQSRQAASKKQHEIQQQLDKLQGEEQKLLQEQAGFQANLTQYRSMVQVLQASEYTNFSAEQMKEKLLVEQQKISSIERAYEEARQTLQEFVNALNVLKERKEVAQEGCEKLKKKADNLNEEIRSLCVDKDFESVQEVMQLINLELDTDAEQDEILTYRNQLHNAEVTLHKLQVELQGRRYVEEEHRELQTKFQSLKAEILVLQEKSTLLRQRIADAQERKERGEAIQVQLEEQQMREANLKELVSLFRGSGFVNYASTVLLENLCQVANQRFMKLTQNSLRLELNEENEFVVRDYLNEGKVRLLKTLSGGQTFQASLCLALALAENVKSLNQSDQSFFFLDEGFGALDRESLRVVFDTLKSLRQENRIVGIISHVEELQHEIDVFLRIEKDRQYGSMIHTSWE